MSRLNEVKFRGVLFISKKYYFVLVVLVITRVHMQNLVIGLSTFCMKSNRQCMRLSYLPVMKRCCLLFCCSLLLLALNNINYSVALMTITVIITIVTVEFIMHTRLRCGLLAKNFLNI